MRTCVFTLMQFIDFLWNRTEASSPEDIELSAGSSGTYRCKCYLLSNVFPHWPLGLVSISTRFMVHVKSWVFCQSIVAFFWWIGNKKSEEGFTLVLPVAYPPVYNAFCWGFSNIINILSIPLRLVFRCGSREETLVGKDGNRDMIQLEYYNRDHFKPGTSA